MSKGSTIIQSLPYWTLLALAALLPISALTVSNVPSLMTKVMVGGVLVLLAVFFFAISQMKNQELQVPKSLILVSAWFVPVAYLLSTLFAAGGNSTFFGERLSMDSAVFMIIAALTVTVTALVLNTPKKALAMYLAMLVAAVLLTAGETIIFFARGLVQSFNLQSVSLVGSLNDLGIYYGLIAIFVLLSLILLPVNKLMKYALYAVLAASAVFLMIVNLTPLWWIVGAFALAFFVYTATDLFAEKSNDYSKLSFASLAVLAIAVLFIFVPATNSNGETTFTGFLATKANVGEFDVRPSWETTVSIGSQAWGEHGTFLGSGPGSFYHNWSQFLPDTINVTAFWLTDFFYGIGLVPTSIITTGLLGALAWLLFFGIFLWRGTRGLLESGSTQRGDIIGYLRVTSFVAALYLWINAVIQIPSPALILYASLLTGVFVASLAYGTDVTKYMKFAFRSNPRVGFLATLTLTLLLIGSAGGIYGLYSRYSAEASFQNAVLAYTQIDNSNAEKAETQLKGVYDLAAGAVNKNKIDIYYRFLSNIDIKRIENKLNQGKSPEEVKVELENLLSSAIGNAMKATELDERDYQNWANLGSVYQSTSVLGIDGVTESAIGAYDNALKYRPKSPSVYYAKALLERQSGNAEAARENVNNAITLRNQYTEAIFLLAQMQIENNEVESAIKSVEAITLFNPGNAVAFFQLGLLHYSIEDFVSAVQTFERAVSITPNYANARYFLALAHWKLGDDAEAINNFREVLKTNPENEDVEKILENLESGLDPFAHLEEAQDSIGNIDLPDKEDIIPDPLEGERNDAPLDIPAGVGELVE